MQIMRTAKMASALACGLAALSLTGCNAGLAGVLIWLLLEDDENGEGAPPPPQEVLSSLELVNVQNSRSTPDKALIRFIIVNDASVPANLSIDAAPEKGGVPDGEFKPATLVEPLPGTLGAPGRLVDLKTAPCGLTYEVGWNAAQDLGGDGRSSAVLRFRLDKVKEPILATVPVGNDPPAVEIVSLTPAEGGQIVVDVVIRDSGADGSTGDPVDLLVEFALPVSLEGDPSYHAATTIGATTELASTPQGHLHQFRWDSLADSGTSDRPAIVRVTPRDRVEGQPGKQGEPATRGIALDNNQPPEVDILEEEMLTDADRRRGIAIGFLVRDVESNPVDAVIQWAQGDEPFPELSPALDNDETAREELLSNAAAREAVHILTLRSEVLAGRVESPADASGLTTREVLATWLKSTLELRGLEPGAVRGRSMEIFSPAGGPAQLSSVCSYSAGSGILQFEPPLEGPAEPGGTVRIDLGGAYGSFYLASSPQGVLHRVIWDSGAETPGGGNFRFRITPYDRVVSASGKGCVSPGPPLVSSGDRGLPSEARGAKEMLGPFFGEDPQVLDLQSIDAPKGLASADIDGDGRADFACAAALSNTTVLLLQTAPGIFDPVRLGDSRLKGPSAIAARDLDGDGDVDLAVTGAESKNILVTFQGPGLDLFSNRMVLTGGRTLEHPDTLIAADLDLDGDVDLAVTDSESSSGAVRVFFRGSALGGVQCDATEAGYGVCSLRDPEGESRLLALTAADVLGDANLDLVAVGEGGFVIYSFDASENSPGAPLSYRVKRVSVPGSELSCVAATDVGGDGKLDLAACDRKEPALVIAIQETPGTFGAPQRTPSSGLWGPVALIAGDLDGNSVVDFAVADAGEPTSLYGGNVHLFFGTSSGRYSSLALERKPNPRRVPSSPRALLALDVQGDGRLELVSADDGSRDIAIFRLTGPGSFTESAVSVGAGQEVPEPSSLEAVDLDADGRIDFLSANRTTNDLTWFRQVGPAAFAALRIALPAAYGKGPIALAAGDVDGDGRGDVVTANFASGDVALLLQEEDGAFGRVARLSSDGLRGPTSVALGDMTGDGRLDVVVAGRYSDDIRWFAQRGDGSFEAAAVLKPDPGAGVEMRGPLVAGIADMDSDGRADIVAVNQLSKNAVVYYQSATRGQFESPSSISLGTGSTPVSMAIADLDGNGLADIVTANLGAEAVCVLLQKGSRSFDLSTLPADPIRSATDVALRDLNGDGKADIAVSFSAQDALIRVYFQGPGGTFEGARSLQLSSDDLATPIGLVVADVDRDGDGDISVAGRRSRNVLLFYGGR